MRLTLLSTLLIVSIFSSFSQTQIPNGDFENWVYYPYCFGLDSTNNFLTGDAFTYLNTKKQLGSATCPGSPNYKSGDSQSGSYALTISAQYIQGEPYYNFVTLGKAKDYGSMGISSEGVPFTGRPVKLTGYYKLSTEVTDDALQIQVFGSNTTSTADNLFYGEFSTTTNLDLYKKFEIDLVYDPTDPNNPIILQLLISVGNSDDGSIDENTVATIDNLVFEYATTTSTVNYSATSPINVFAVNKNINFSENVSDVYVVDMVGAQKISETGTTKILNAASLTTGMYIVTYKYNDAYFSKKVVIE